MFTSYSSKKTSKIIINGKTYHGNNIVVKNNKVHVNDKTEDIQGSELSIKVEGDICDLTIDNGNVNITGDVRGDIACCNVDITGNVEGDIAGNSITVGGNCEGDIAGNTIKVNNG